MAKHQIKHRRNDAVLFECDVPDDMESGLRTRYVLEKAVKSGAYLSGAYLTGANLYGANLTGANLYGANMTGAYLTGANLYGAKLIGERPVFIVGPIGSRCDYFTSYLTDNGIYLLAGCFFGSVAEFAGKLRREHGENNHAQEYTAALELIRCHARLWTPSTCDTASETDQHGIAHE